MFFGWNQHRRNLLDGLAVALQDLRRIRCKRAWLDGSFVTNKNYPNDFDLCWDMDDVDWDNLAAPLEDLKPPRQKQKAIYLGDVIPNVVESSSGQPFLDFFQEDTQTGRIRGIVELTPWASS